MIVSNGWLMRICERYSLHRQYWQTSKARWRGQKPRRHPSWMLYSDFPLAFWLLTRPEKNLAPTAHYRKRPDSDIIRRFPIFGLRTVINWNLDVNHTSHPKKIGLRATTWRNCKVSSYFVGERTRWNSAFHMVRRLFARPPWHLQAHKTQWCR